MYHAEVFHFWEHRNNSELFTTEQPETITTEEIGESICIYKL
jgi:hypothetical protein